MNASDLSKEFWAGGTAGAIGVVIGFPFDLIKVQIQTHPGKFSSAWQCLKSTVKAEGFGALYKGCLPPLIASFFVVSLTFVGEGLVINLLEPDWKNTGVVQSPFVHLLSGGFGGFLHCIALVPTDVVKCNMQAGTFPPCHSPTPTPSPSLSPAPSLSPSTSPSLAYKPTSTISNNPSLPTSSPSILRETLACAQNIYRADGIKGLYRGFNITVLREVPCIAVYFSSYKHLRQMLGKYEEQWNRSWQAARTEKNKMINSCSISSFTSGVGGIGVGGVIRTSNISSNNISSSSSSSSNISSNNNFSNSNSNSNSSSSGISSNISSNNILSNTANLIALPSEVTRLPTKNTSTPGHFATIVAGGIAGAISWTIVYPFDVIKTNMQVMSSQRNETEMQVARRLLHTHGPRIFLNGLGPTVLRAFPVNGATFFFYEIFRQRMEL